jgi:DNA-binding HxlR family transcriptional regulator
MKSARACPVHKTAALLSDTWTMLIVRDLLHGPKRFCDLERSLESISTRTLTLKLKKLEAERLIRKRADGSYSVTAKGKGLRPVESAMRRYGEKYL